MRIAVRRTGGFAGLTMRWAVDVTQPELGDIWMPLIESCPWEDVPDLANQPDRYMYSISAGERNATLPEREVTGPWRDLVDRTRDAARHDREAAAPLDQPGEEQAEVLAPERLATEPSRPITGRGNRLFPRRPEESDDVGPPQPS
ncbi:hypothetical protein D477_008178 [Arthrobacter crystallopoietes BAB-32]|uniref:Uncharacterized protein n=1 Tax=Arthrobacter crystallopoietes BAB-32 TaxID=1246476 RepID=N1V0A8_9MICC|nr:hypothetical protein D477_008178 [Arthrobacter crystallopoietes BAB-32]